MKKFSPKDELKSQKGQILIESVVAMSLIVIGLLGILTLLSNSIAFNRNVANKLTATYLAEGIEVMKSIADENYTQKNHGAPFCRMGIMKRLTILPIVV